MAYDLPREIDDAHQTWQRSFVIEHALTLRRSTTDERDAGHNEPSKSIRWQPAAASGRDKTATAFSRLTEKRSSSGARVDAALALDELNERIGIRFVDPL